MAAENSDAILEELRAKKGKKLIKNKNLFLILVTVFVLVGLFSTYFLSDYLKRAALNNLAKSNAEDTSVFIFEIMYTKMQDGWNKEEIEKIVTRMNSTHPGMKVGVYRSPIVEQLYGVIEKDRQKVASDPVLGRAMKGEALFLPNPDDNSIRYVYPLAVEQDCLRCHTNAKIGEINGVIDIYMPANNIQIPLENIMRYFIIFTAIAIVATFAIFQLLVSRIFINPITNFTNAIDSIMINDVFNDYIKCNSKTHEVHVLEVTFNHLLAKVNDMLGEIRNKNKLLEEYKSAIDRSTIVSKTDKDGIITYVNEQFCLISGYKQEELIGKNHNMVRSPNMPKEAFKEVWETIQDKRAWSGVVENRKKNGESYFVNATIMPILDEHNEIVEFIGIRQDITELKQLQLEELDSSINRALEINTDEMVGLLTLPCACIDEEGRVISSNGKFKDHFGRFDFSQIALDDIFIKAEGYVYKDEILDWKQTVMDLQDEVSQKALIEIDDEPKEFFVMASKVSGRELYAVFLVPFTFCRAVKK